MDALMRRRMMMLAGSGPTPPPVVTPVYYNYLVFDGTAYIESNYVFPSGGSMRCLFGHETSKAMQRIFFCEGGGGYIAFAIGGGSNSTRRQMVPYYDSTSYLASNRYLNWSYSTYGLFMTQNRFGWGNTAYAYSKGSTHPTGGICFGGGGSAPFTGAMQTFYVYGSDTASLTTYAAFENYTPVATFRPCTYNGVAGLWYVEGNTFYGNTAGSGMLTAADTI